MTRKTVTGSLPPSATPSATTLLDAANGNGTLFSVICSTSLILTMLLSPYTANPAYKGKWYAPLIDNPAYIGEWAPRTIPNPNYFEDLTPVKSLKPIVSLVFCC